MQNTTQTSPYIIVITTTDQKHIAQKISQTLLEKRVAACVQITSCQSHYLWKGEVTHSTEWRLEIKSTQQHFEAIETTINTLHNYDIPEIIALPLIAINQKYQLWLQETLQNTPKSNT